MREQVLCLTTCLRCVDSQSGVGHAPAGDVSLNLGLVDPVDADPDKCPSDCQGPEGVSP